MHFSTGHQPLKWPCPMYRAAMKMINKTTKYKNINRTKGEKSTVHFVICCWKDIFILVWYRPYHVQLTNAKHLVFQLLHLSFALYAIHLAGKVQSAASLELREIPLAKYRTRTLFDIILCRSIKYARSLLYMLLYALALNKPKWLRSVDCGGHRKNFCLQLYMVPKLLYVRICIKTYQNFKLIVHMCFKPVHNNIRVIFCAFKNWV